MSTGERDDPYRGFNFSVQIDGIEKIGFSEVSGLSSDGDVVEYRNGNSLRMSKLPGLPKFANITFKGGYTRSSKDLWDWRMQVIRGDFAKYRRDGAITLLDEGRKPVMTWAFQGGWVHKIDGPTFNAKGNDVAIETLEIVVENLELTLEE